MYKTPLTSERKVILATIALFFGWLFAIIPSSRTFDDQFEWSLPRSFCAKSIVPTKTIDVVVLDGTGRRLAFSPFKLKAIEPSSDGNSESELVSASRNLFLIYDKSQYQAKPVQAAENMTASISSQKPILEQISEQNARNESLNSAMNPASAGTTSDVLAADSETTLQEAGGNSGQNVESQNWTATELQTPEFAPPMFDDATPANWSDKICNLDIDWNSDFQETEDLSVARNDVENAIENRKKSVRVGNSANILESDPLFMQETNYNETSGKKTSGEESSNQIDEKLAKPIERHASKPISQTNDGEETDASLRQAEEKRWKTFADDKTTPAFAVSSDAAKNDVPVSGIADFGQINSAREASHIAERREKPDDLVAPEAVPIVSVSTGRTVVLAEKATPQEIAKKYSLSNDSFEFFLELNHRQLDANGVFAAQTLIVIPNDESLSQK